MTIQEREGAINRQGSSYRQRFVLGLTMAEIMLLLVFCLLIAMSTVLRTEQRKNDELEKKLHEAGESSLIASNGLYLSSGKKYPELYERVRKATEAEGANSIDEYWRELVDAKSFVSDLEKDGVSPDAAKRLLVEAEKFKASGIDPDQAKADAALLKKLVRLLPNEHASKSRPL